MSLPSSGVGCSVCSRRGCACSCAVAVRRNRPRRCCQTRRWCGRQGAHRRGVHGELIELPELTELPGYQEEREVRGRSLLTAVLAWAGGRPIPPLTRWEAVFLAMKAEGVPNVFGLPGDPGHVYDALIASEADGGPRPIGSASRPPAPVAQSATSANGSASIRWPVAGRSPRRPHTSAG